MALLHVLLAICIAVAAVQGQKPSTTLRTRPDGTFRIAQFTDMHYGESNIWDAFTAYKQGEILASEKPDIVVITGDAVSGYAWDGNQTGWFAPLWAALTKPMIDANVKYAFTFGNHDDGGEYSRKQIMELEQKINVSLSQSGPPGINGTTNYILPIYSHNTSNTVPVAILYMFDSSDVECEGVQGWGCVYPSQIDWYTNISTALTQKYGKVIPGLAFFHIPVPEFMYMWNTDTCNGQLEDTGVCCFSVNTGLFAAFKRMGDIISVHCGHDHNNDFYGYHDGIMLAYGRKTGFGGYGPPAGWLRGSRILQIQESPFKLTHWIRQEDGTVVPAQQQPVHSPGSNMWHYCCGTVNASLSNCKAYADDFNQHHAGY